MQYVKNPGTEARLYRPSWEGGGGLLKPFCTHVPVKSSNDKVDPFFSSQILSGFCLSTGTNSSLHLACFLSFWLPSEIPAGLRPCWDLQSLDSSSSKPNGSGAV